MLPRLFSMTRFSGQRARSLLRRGVPGLRLG